MVFGNASNLAKIGFSTIAISLFLLLLAYLAVKSKHYRTHKLSMVMATISNSLFLIFYIIRLVTEGNSEFEGPNWFFKSIYIPILTIHILTAIASIYFVIVQLYSGFKGEAKDSNSNLILSGKYRLQHVRLGPRAIVVWGSSFIGGISVFLMLYVLF